MTVWSPTDVRAIAPAGGCGEIHSAPEGLAKGDMMSVDCPTCEPLILGLGWGWATDPAHVELTPDERLAAEAADREGSVATNLAMREFGRAVADRVHGPAPVAPATLMEQIAAMSAEDKAALAAALAPTPTPTSTPASVPAKKTAAKATPATTKD
jgi:hypothetical protein